MSNIYKKQIEIFIPPYRTAILENLLRVARLGPFASIYPDLSVMNVEVKEMILDNEAEIDDDLPDITDALIDTTNCNYTQNEEEQEELIMSNRIQKPVVNSPSSIS